MSDKTTDSLAQQLANARVGLKPRNTVFTDERGNVHMERITGDPLVDERKTEEKKASQERMKAPWIHMHGRLGAKNWAAPIITKVCNEDARPGYNTCKAHEYNEDPETFSEKIKKLAEIIQKSKRCIAYTGAGISTASGIADYASRDSGRPKLMSPFDAQPTLAHRVLAALHKEGFLKNWIQQNHDGLPQKAGYPQKDLNEIHGSWYDPSNPVVMMSGNLREDLFSWLIEWEKKSDLCLTLGTSLCGMNSDRMALTCSKQNPELGTVIISLQQTQLDEHASLRFFSTCDKVMGALAKEMNLKLPEEKVYIPNIPKDTIVEQDVFLVGYDAKTGKKNGDERFKLDLRVDSKVVIPVGQYKGVQGTVQGKNREGHYKICFYHRLKKGSKIKRPQVRVLGRWWIEAATNGTIDQLPLIPLTISAD